MNFIQTFAHQNDFLVPLYAVPVFKNKLKPGSLSTNWIENEGFGLVFEKRSVLKPKTGTIYLGTLFSKLPLLHQF
jgi:hypothetical protein